MTNLFFKTRAGNQRATDASWLPLNRTGGQDGLFLREDAFARGFALERKRVERSHKLLLLMLLDAGSLLQGQTGSKALPEIVSALSSSTRETDVKGWYKKGSIIGVIFTEIGDGENTLIRDTVLARVTHHLESRLEAAQVEAIRISLRFFPDDWRAEKPDSSGSQDLHPDVFRNDDMKRSARVLKRMIDVAGSSLAIITLSPLCVLIVLLIKLTSRGPVLFRQKRVGQRGRQFECLKFRSMHAANDPDIHKEYVRKFILGRNTGGASQASTGTVYKITEDPRITSFGRFLRNTSLDELPQFWNVLKGEMSLVGPRPAIPYELECYDVWHRRRVLEVKPGITGLWQVNGRSRTTFDEMVRLDLKYVRTWSVWLDLTILLKTPKVVMSGEGAY